ncbi:MAG: phosphatidylglycerophosphatase A [Gammaproteobacteria bacterium]|nr:MAG: phosphatidylglycerophosphatase A [Gammaproteobacteria bacterium]
MTPIEALNQYRGSDRLIVLLATGLGSGLVPKMPGTVASVVASILAWLFVWLTSPIAVVSVAVIGIFVCERAAKLLGQHDHQAIVWDEWSGLWLTYAIVLPSTAAEFAGLLLFFRLFDILKPWPIRWADKQVSGGLGIMVDDWLAGIMAAGSYWGLIHYAL